jgi:hypothetical protein
MNDSDIQKIIERLRYTPAPHPGHAEHLCVLWPMYRDVEKLKEIVKDAKFVCKTCGRAAASQRLLCEPVPI